MWPKRKSADLIPLGPLLLALILFIVVVPAHCQSFYAAGISLLPQASPKPTGWAAAIITANAKQRIYSISEIDFTVVGDVLHGKPFSVQTSARTGAALWLRTFKSVDLYTLADAGAATNGVNSSGAGAIGGVATFPTRWSALKGAVGARVLKTALSGTQVLVELGIVWGGGK